MCVCVHARMQKRKDQENIFLHTKSPIFSPVPSCCLSGRWFECLLLRATGWLAGERYWRESLVRRMECIASQSKYIKGKQLTYTKR